MIDRRTFIGAVTAGVIASPLWAGAQTVEKMRRIGVLSPGAPLTAAELAQESASFRAFGWVVGRNLVVERRSANGRADLLNPYAAELVRLKVEIIVTEGTAATLAAKSATTSIPIVIWSAGDPVRAGLVASLARPGGNITGFAGLGPELDAKRLALLRELLPGLQRVGVLLNSTNSYKGAVRTEFEQSCRSLGLHPIIIEVAAAEEFDPALAEMLRQRAQALLVQADGLFYDYRVLLLNAALKHALPTVVADKVMLGDGALVHYGITDAELYHRNAAFVDRILRGAKPAELPIERPTKFELAINLKTAKALGITIPQSLLLRADEVIQ